MKRTRQILAIAGIVFLLAIYASTLVFALMKNPAAERLLMASVFCTVAVPVILYGVILVARSHDLRAGLPVDEESGDEAEASDADDYEAGEGGAADSRPDKDAAGK